MAVLNHETNSKIEDSDRWSGEFSSLCERYVRLYCGPLFLILITPIFVNIAALTCRNHQCSFTDLWIDHTRGPAFSYYSIVAAIIVDSFRVPSNKVVGVVLAFCLFQFVLFKCIPGKLFPGKSAAYMTFISSFL